MYYEAINFPNVKVLSIATRADCFNEDIYNLLADLNKKIEVWIELGLQSCGLQDFLKRFLPKLSATRTLRLCRSLCLRHLRDIVFMLSPPCSPPLCVIFICSRLNLSLHISEEPIIRT